MNFTFRIVTTGLTVSCLSIGVTSILGMQSAYGVQLGRAGFHAPARIGGIRPNNAFRGGMRPGLGNMRGGAMHNFNNRPGINRIEHNDMARRDNWGGAGKHNFDRRPGTDNFKHNDLARRDNFDRMKERGFDRHPGMDNSRRDLLARRDDFGRMQGQHFDRRHLDNSRLAGQQSPSNNNNSNPITANTGVHSGSYFKIGQ